MKATAGELAVLALAAEVAAVVGDQRNAAELYDALRMHELERVPTGCGTLPAPCVAYYLGLLAQTTNRPENALRYLEQAVTVHLQAGEMAWAAKVRCTLARALLARGDDVSRRRARVEIEAVLAWSGANESASGDEAVGLLTRITGAEDGASNVIRCEGDFWTVAFGGRVCHLRNSRGLHWLALLLRHPGREFPALDLVQGGNDASHPGCQLPVDARAAERARVRLTRALQHAVARIAASHHELGRHLAVTVRTGRVCAYLPDSRVPIQWTG